MPAEQVKYSLTADRISKTLAKAKPDEYPHLRALPEGTAVEFEGTYDFGGNLEGFVDLFGEDVAYKYAKQAVGLALGGHVRDLLEAGKSPAQVQEEITSWKPGTISRKPKKSTQDSMVDELLAKSPEEREAELQAIRDKIAALEAERAEA